MSWTPASISKLNKTVTSCRRVRVRLSLCPSGEVLMICEELEDVGGSETNRIIILQPHTRMMPIQRCRRLPVKMSTVTAGLKGHGHSRAFFIWYSAFCTVWVPFDDILHVYLRNTLYCFALIRVDEVCCYQRRARYIRSHHYEIPTCVATDQSKNHLQYRY
jgi:hypothetical protein